jgi:hypothetical protein
VISHVVAPGECLASIAEHYGFADPAVIYNHPENAALRRERPDPNVLLAGDVVAIPDRKLRELRAATVRVSDHGTEEVFQVALGYLDPADSADGVMQRLTNLGYRCEIPGLPADVALRFTISNFQRGTGLPVTGELDDTTRQRLVEVHGS